MDGRKIKRIPRDKPKKRGRPINVERDLQKEAAEIGAALHKSKMSPKTMMTIGIGVGIAAIAGLMIMKIHSRK